MIATMTIHPNGKRLTMAHDYVVFKSQSTGEISTNRVGGLHIAVTFDADADPKSDRYLQHVAAMDEPGGPGVDIPDAVALSIIERCKQAAALMRRNNA